MPQLPSGTVTFVFSDIEGSTALLRRLGDAAFAELLRTHRRLVRETFAAHDGQEIDTQGDAFFYSFSRARSALAAAVAVQRAHADEPWPEGASVRIRLGLHTGEPAVGDEGYTGLDVVRASRIAATGRGGQVLLSETTRAIVASDLPDGVELRPIGERELKDIERPEVLSELVIAGLSAHVAESHPTTATTDRGTSQVLPQATGPALDEFPDWLRGAAERWLPASNRLIEERVLAQLDEALSRRPPAVEPQRRARGRARPKRSASVADEVAKLQALREGGALTDDQYERAVERILADEH
jgi:class 3 adenylate cyclase